MGKRRLKKWISNLIILLILFSFVLFFIWFLNKDEETKPTDSQTPSENVPSKPDDNSGNDEQKPTEDSPNGGEQKPDDGDNPVENTTFLNKVVNREKLNDEQLKLITNFLDTYYKSIKELKEYDMTKYFVNSNSEDALINQTAVSVLVENRKLKPNDLRLSSAKYDLNIDEVKVSGNQIIIKILENSYIRFAFMDDIESKIYNITNNFTIEKINGEYKIVNYKKVQDFYVMITDKYNNGGKNELDKIKYDYIRILKNKVAKDAENYQYFLNGTGIDRKTCDYAYDRNSALNYALNWVNKRNTSEWSTFSSNCQNYASQVVYNGGVIMDYTGSDSSHLQWKFYDSSYNTNQVDSGYVYTWTYVPYFYTYAKDNTGTGLCADVDVNIYYAEAGDVVHVGPSAPTRHAVVVIGDYKVDGKTVDILVNSNTVDLENFPISAYAYPYVSLIKVYGWND